MKVKIKEITDRVYELLDENREILEERVEYCDAGVSLAPLVARLLPDAARIVLCTVPLDLIDECRHIGVTMVEKSKSPVIQPGEAEMIVIPSATWLGDTRAVMRLPADFLRLVNIRMSDWDNGVCDMLAFGSPSHQLRQRRYARQRFSRIRPAVALRSRGDIRYLDIYGTTESATLVEFDYVPEPKVSGSTIEIPGGVVSEVCRKLAEMVGDIIGDRKWE